MKKKIFITGGHFTPALALIEELEKRHDVEIVFIGRMYAIEGESEVSPEYRIMGERHIRFLPITTGRLTRSFTKNTLSSLAKIPIGFITALRYCLNEKPDLIVSFGGYIALPVAMMGARLGIPVITHEQTIPGGLANKRITDIAKKICVSFPETVPVYPKEKVVYTGLPMREDLFTPPAESPYKGLDKKYPILYITGGSTGAATMNDLFVPIIGALVKKYIVIHQAGQVSMEKLLALRQSLPLAVRSRYRVEQYIPVQKLAWILRQAKLVIGRSGANTTLEAAALGKVALFIPLPWAAKNEQLLQAKWLETHGGAAVLDQEGLTPERLLRSIELTLAEHDVLERRAKKFAPSVPRNGASALAAQIEALLAR